MTALIASFSHHFPGRHHRPRLPAALRRLIGPGLLVAVGYVDPGNWATDIAAGSRFGYVLAGTVIVASLLGMLFQGLCARLAIATGKDLARLTHEHLPHGLAIAAWLAGELAIVATALAELIGGALALHLLFGLPLLGGMLVTAGGTLAVMALSSRHQQLHERVVGLLLALVSISFLWLLIRAQPPLAGVLHGAARGLEVVTHPGMLAVALGIVGATVMPHNLYLHSGLVAERMADVDTRQRRYAMRLSISDSRAALAVAMVVNLSMLLVAAASFGHLQMPLQSLAGAYQALGSELGISAAIIFAVALYAAGQSSAITSVMAGQTISAGFDRGPRTLLLRGVLSRLGGVLAGFALITLLPNANADTLLVLSQCILGLALPFALVPLLMLCARRQLMRRFALGRLHLAIAILATALVVGLDVYLLATFNIG